MKTRKQTKLMFSLVCFFPLTTFAADEDFLEFCNRLIAQAEAYARKYLELSKDFNLPLQYKDKYNNGQIRDMIEEAEKLRDATDDEQIKTKLNKQITLMERAIHGDDFHETNDYFPKK